MDANIVIAGIAFFSLFYTWREDKKRENERLQREVESNRREVEFFAEITYINTECDRIVQCLKSIFILLQNQMDQVE